MIKHQKQLSEGNMKKCNQCDRENMNDAKFCQSCGAKLMTPEVISIEPVTVNNQGYEAPPLPDTNTFPEEIRIINTQIPPTNKGLVWLIISSILTFFGCFCYGLGLLQVPTIITSAISVSRHSNRDYEGSERLAKTSMILFFSILALSIIIVIILFSFLLSLTDFTDAFNEFY